MVKNVKYISAKKYLAIGGTSGRKHRHKNKFDRTFSIKSARAWAGTRKTIYRLPNGLYVVKK